MKFVKVIPVCMTDAQGLDVPLDADAYYLNVESVMLFEVDRGGDEALGEMGYAHMQSGSLLVVSGASTNAVLGAIGASSGTVARGLSGEQGGG